MKHKLFYFNILIFLLIMVIAFCFGVYFMHKTNSLSAAEEEADSTPPLIYNIKISDISATSSVITWETDEAADSLINYGLNKKYGVVRDPRADKVEHMIILENLAPDTTYYYRITSSDEIGNQGISSDYSFITPAEDEWKSAEEEHISAGERVAQGLAEEILEEGEGGLSDEAVEIILKAIESISHEDTLEIIDEKVKERAEEVIKPPTIILDMANVEVGTNYAIIPWQTDKLSNSMVDLAEESDYDPEAVDPYTWHEGNSNVLVKDHLVEINGLTPATVYHFRVSSRSELGLTGYSRDRFFKTKAILPEIYNIQIYKIQEESATIRWSTNVPCSSIVEYTNLNNNNTKLEGNSSYLTFHSMKLTNLIFDTYYSAMIKVESEEGENAESYPLTFITTRDEFPPVISKVNTESTLYPGSENKIQTIASWETDESAMCQLFYHQGLVVIEEPDALPKEEDYGARHVHVITNFLPSTVYKFWIVCEDEAENKIRSEDFTMLTPIQEESIIDIIIKNFESTFGWVKKLKL